MVSAGLSDQPTKTQAQRCRDWHNAHIPFWRRYWDAMNDEAEFLDGDRTENDVKRNRDRRLVQIHGQEIQDTIRHLVAKATEKPIRLMPRPVDADQDPDQGEIAVAVCDHEMTDPWKEFPDCLEDAIIDSREKRLGVMYMDFDKDCGPFGEILYQRIAPDRIMWDEAFWPHHPKCDVVRIEVRVNTEVARETYGAPWLEPDRGVFESNGDYRPGVPLIQGGDGQRMPRPDSADEDKSTLWLFYYKNDRSKKYGKPRTKMLPESERYMTCDMEHGGCGHRTVTQGELQAQEGISEPYPLESPPMTDANPEQGCPECGALLRRVDTKAMTPMEQAYAKGKRLTILSPYCTGEKDGELYDGGWVVPTARSYPLLLLTAYRKPGAPMGPSDVTLMWDQQFASDVLISQAVESVLGHRPYFVMPSVGLYAGNGERFAFRDDHFNVIYRDQSAAEFGPLNIDVINATGVDPEFAQVWGVVNGALTQYRGVTDFGPVDASTLSQTSGVALQQREAIGEIPVAHYNRRKAREIGKFAGVLWDYIRATYTTRKLARLNLDGVDLVQGLNGDDLPNYDFRIEDEPDFTGLEEARQKASDWCVATLSNPATEPYFDILAKLNNIPTSTVRDFEKRRQQIQEMQAEAEAQAAAEQAGGAPGGGGQPTAPGGLSEGPNGPGAAPAMVPGMNGAPSPAMAGAA